MCYLIILQSNLFLYCVEKTKHQKNQTQNIRLLAFCLWNLRDYADYAGKIQTEYFEKILQFIEK